MFRHVRLGLAGRTLAVMWKTLYLIFCILYVPVNNFSIMSGGVFMGWTSTEARTSRTKLSAYREARNISSQALYHWAIALHLNNEMLVVCGDALCLLFSCFPGLKQIEYLAQWYSALMSFDWKHEWQKASLDPDLNCLTFWC